jgi:SP family galactose:H+ symporter-like MFS transporter
MGLAQDLKGASRLGVLVAISAATVGVIYGYDSSNIGGALLYLKEAYHLSEAKAGLVASIVVFGEIAGALIGGRLADRFGRKPVMVGVAATFALFSLMSALAWDIPSLMAARFLLGLTIGVSVVVVPVFVAESAATKIRGALLVLYQVATVTGIILGYVIAMILAQVIGGATDADAGNTWRWLLGLAAIPGVIVTLLLLRLPDTARWYVMKGRRAEAERVMTQIDPTADITRELDDLEDELHSGTALTLTQGLRKMFTGKYLRASIFVIGLGFFVQITGINAVVYYGPQIFEAMGVESDIAKLGLSALVQVFGLLAVFGSMAIVDRVGRRPILLTGIGVMIAANLLLIVTFLNGTEKGDTVTLGGSLTVLAFIGLVLFVAGFTLGFGALVWVYAGESFPSDLRSLGSSAMLTSDLVANVIVGLVTLQMLKAWGGSGTFMFFGAMAVLAFIFIAKLAPETKGRPLDDIRHYWENDGHWPAPEAITDAGTDAAAADKA